MSSRLDTHDCRLMTRSWLGFRKRSGHVKIGVGAGVLPHVVRDFLTSGSNILGNREASAKTLHETIQLLYTGVGFGLATSSTNPTTFT